MGPGELCSWLGSQFRVYAVDQLWPGDYGTALESPDGGDRPYMGGYGVLFRGWSGGGPEAQVSDQRVVFPPSSTSCKESFVAVRSSQAKWMIQAAKDTEAVCPEAGSHTGNAFGNRHERDRATTAHVDAWQSLGDCSEDLEVEPGEFCLWGTQPFYVYGNGAGVFRIHNRRDLVFGANRVVIKEGDVEKFRAMKVGLSWQVLLADTRSNAE